MRASYCRVEVCKDAGRSAREVAFDIIKRVCDQQPMFQGHKLWFTVNKTKEEREVAAFVARTMRMLSELGAHACEVDGDFKRGIVRFQNTRVADIQQSKQFPLVQPVCEVT